MILKPFFSALRFLTILPVPESWCGDEVDFHKSPDWYPAVGLLIGLMLVCVDQILLWLLPLPVASVLLLTVMLGISGALHLDGLADSADAFFSSRGRDKMLDIMKDSRSGPMGVMTIVLVLFLKLSLLVSLPLHYRWQAILLMPLAGRCSLTIISQWLPYARQTGTAAFINKYTNTSRSLLASLIMGVVAVALLGGVGGVLTVALTGAATWSLGRYSRNKIGGYTGDTLGATCELIELLPALSVVMFVQLGMM